MVRRGNDVHTRWIRIRPVGTFSQTSLARAVGTNVSARLKIVWNDRKPPHLWGVATHRVSGRNWVNSERAHPPVAGPLSKKPILRPHARKVPSPLRGFTRKSA